MKYLHTMVRVADLDASLDFYCAKLGLVEASRVENSHGRFTLVFLCAPGDEDMAKASKAPMVELTYNWDPEAYEGGRNFGHLAYAVDDIYALCQRLQDAGVVINRPPRGLATRGLRPFPRQHLHRVAAGRACPGAGRALGLHAQRRGLVGVLARRSR